jgi:hypothetical protein
MGQNALAAPSKLLDNGLGRRLPMTYKCIPTPIKIRRPVPSDIEIAREMGLLIGEYGLAHGLLLILLLA